MFRLKEITVLLLLVAGALWPSHGYGQVGNWVRPVTPDDVVHAAQWVAFSAEQGMPWAEYMLGTLYETGRGVPQDAALAAKWYARAAASQEASAAYRLGLLYHRGEGVAQSDAEALRWFREAADQEHAEAQAAMGDLYASGRGVPEDLEKAVTWWRKGADGGVPDARFKLGMAAALGHGMAPDKQHAGEWMYGAALHFLELARPADANRCLEAMRSMVPDHPRTAELAARLVPAQDGATVDVPGQQAP